MRLSHGDNVDIVTSADTTGAVESSTRSLESSAGGSSAASSTTTVKTLAVLGTGSDVGKSVLAAGICRILSRSGMRVAPFKAQNMSNNASPALITATDDKEQQDEDGDGTTTTTTTSTGCWGEIGTAQALQAQACGLVPRVEMNPILLKSGGQRESDGAYLCSVIVRGKHYMKIDYGKLGTSQTTCELQNLVLTAHQSLSKLTNSEYIIAEGAGSCTELNLMDRDVVNIPLVRKLHCPWILVADIDKGGVFAQIIGTHACLSNEDWDLCCGIVVNRLRGDPKFFEPGPRIIYERVHKPVFVVPWLYGIHLPEEDGVGIEQKLRTCERQHQQQSSCDSSVDYGKNNIDNNHTKKPVVVVVAYPYVAIDSDLLPLERDPTIHVEWRRTVLPSRSYPHTHAIVLPGSRLTRFDLDWLINRTGWGDYIKDHVKRGGTVLGLCGGYQMLGMIVGDRDGIEGEPGSTVGLGLLPVKTDIQSTDQKTVTPRTAILNGIEHVEGFELHCGTTSLIPPEERMCDESTTTQENPEPLLRILETETDDGIRVGKVSGCYLHGILDNRNARKVLLNLLPMVDNKDCNGIDNGDTSICNNEVGVDESLDKLADHLESCGLTAEKLVEMLSFQSKDSK